MSLYTLTNLCEDVAQKRGRLLTDTRRFPSAVRKVGWNMN